jgi:hypothetical protein
VFASGREDTTVFVRLCSETWTRSAARYGTHRALRECTIAGRTHSSVAARTLTQAKQGDEDIDRGDRRRRDAERECCTSASSPHCGGAPTQAILQRTLQYARNGVLASERERARMRDTSNPKARRGAQIRVYRNVAATCADHSRVLEQIATPVRRSLLVTIESRTGTEREQQYSTGHAAQELASGR